MDLSRFYKPQENAFEVAYSEIKAGHKRGHWMWYIFPQIAGLGMTDISKYYAIRDIDEATEFLKDPVLGKRLISICEALLDLGTDDPHEIFGSPDDLKLRSSMTLFAAVPDSPPVFGRVLAKFYQGQPDSKTLELLGLHK